MRFDPFRELDRWSSQLTRQALMPIDAYRHGDRFLIHVDLPGVDADSIDLTVEQNVLTVTAERRWERQDAQEVLVAERPQGRFTRQLFLGDGLDTERVEASYDNGVLTVTVPVAEAARPRKVQVTGGNGSAKAIPADSAEHRAA